MWSLFGAVWRGVVLGSMIGRICPIEPPKKRRFRYAFPVMAPSVSRRTTDSRTRGATRISSRPGRPTRIPKVHLTQGIFQGLCMAYVFKRIRFWYGACTGTQKRGLYIIIMPGNLAALRTDEAVITCTCSCPGPAGWFILQWKPEGWNKIVFQPQSLENKENEHTSPKAHNPCFWSLLLCKVLFG